MLTYVTRGFALALVALSLSACETTQFNGYSASPNASTAFVQNPDINGGKLSESAKAKLTQYGKSCYEQLKPQMAGPAQSFANGAVPYGIAGYVGVGIGAKQAFGSAVSGGKYGLYGGIAGALSGGANGLVTGSYSMDAARGQCVHEFWEDVRGTNPEFAGAHVVTVYAGKKLGGSEAPGATSSK